MAFSPVEPIRDTPPPPDVAPERRTRTRPVPGMTGVGNQQAPATMVAVMAQDNQKTTNQPKKMPPDLQDVEPGSDADATPLPEVGKTPPDPNKSSDGNTKAE
jgi:hypothetical protein